MVYTNHLKQGGLLVRARARANVYNYGKVHKDVFLRVKCAGAK